MEQRMPIINIKMLDKGRTVEQKRELVEKITDICVETLETKRENVTITIDEMPLTNYARGGKLYSDQ